MSALRRHLTSVALLDQRFHRVSQLALIVAFPTVKMFLEYSVFLALDVATQARQAAAKGYGPLSRGRAAFLSRHREEEHFPPNMAHIRRVRIYWMRSLSKKKGYDQHIPTTMARYGTGIDDAFAALVVSWTEEKAFN